MSDIDILARIGFMSLIIFSILSIIGVTYFFSSLYDLFKSVEFQDNRITNVLNHVNEELKDIRFQLDKLKSKLKDKGVSK